jgi:hypothetical protein
MTHVKVVAVALVCATLVAGIGLAARVTDESADGRLEATVIKAGKPLTASTGEPPLTVYVFSTPVLRAPSGALFFCAPVGGALLETPVWRPGHTCKKFRDRAVAAQVIRRIVTPAAGASAGRGLQGVQHPDDASVRPVAAWAARDRARISTRRAAPLRL